MEKVLPVSKDILDAWTNLEKFLTEKYGEKVATYHEVPFKHHYEGQIFTGSIDFIWETKDGVVLVDFKSYPGHKDDVVNPSHEHYAGMYAGQFECYERALKAAGKSVIAKVVYYHVLGVCVEI
jgi:ATP-dependent exoDNAse (exonuclease V) beta subunit